MAAISLLLLIFLSISSYSIHGNSASALDCSSVIQNMAGCLSFVTIESEVDKPEGLFVLPWSQESDRSNAECLCEVFKYSGSMGIKMNIAKASSLPVLCKLTTPSISSCRRETSIFSSCRVCLSCTMTKQSFLIKKKTMIKKFD